MFDTHFFLKPRSFQIFFLAALLFFPRNAWAGPDFYGVKMKSEDFARNVMLQENYVTPDFSNERPGTDKRVYALGYTSSFLGRGRGLSITVFNHSDKPIGTERLFRECVVLTNEGKRYDRSHPEMEWHRDALAPGQEATFNISFPGVNLRSQDIRMITLSFGLGETKIFLFPMAPPAPPQAAPVKKIEKPKAEKPKAKPKLRKKETPKLAPSVKEVEKETSKETAPASKLSAHCVAPIKVMQSLLRRVTEKVGDIAAHRRSPAPPEAEETDLSGTETQTGGIPAPETMPAKEEPGVVEVLPQHPDKDVPVNYPYQKTSQVIEGVTYNFRPDFQRAVQEAEKQTVETVTKDRPWSLGNPDTALVRKEPYEMNTGVLPRDTAQVVIVNPNNIFIVFNAGLEDGVAPNSIVSVLRGGRRVGKAMASKVRDRITAAVVLPEWRTKDKIQVGDVVSLTE